MNLRLRLILYLTTLHFAIAGTGIYFLWNSHKPWILLLEVVVIGSYIIGLQIIKGFGLHLDIISSGADFIREKDFSHTFSEVKPKDINQLVKIYNEMISHLREEKILLEEQQVFLQKVLNASPSGILSLDFNDCVRMYNPSVLEFLEIETKEITGKKLTDFSSDLISRLITLPIGKTEVFSLNTRRKLRCSHLQYRERGFLCSFYLVEEMTHELWESERSAYETLIRTLSHEVNNTVGATNSILRSCLTYGSQLNSEDKEDFENALNVAIERTDLLNQFMASYADVIRLPDPVKGYVDPLEILQRIKSLLGPESNKRNIAIEIHPDDNNWKVSLDMVQMEQALMNILRNSMEAIDQDGKIDIHLLKKNHSKYLVIEDNGPGLTDEVSQSLFTPFFSTKENGQGIGLTLTREILTKHGMVFSLQTDKDNITRFTIQLGK